MKNVCIVFGLILMGVNTLTFGVENERAVGCALTSSKSDPEFQDSHRNFIEGIGNKKITLDVDYFFSSENITLNYHGNDTEIKA